MNRTSLALALVIASLAAGASAQHEEIRQTGFHPEKLYQFSDLDHVNLFNGNLIITIPMGESYPLGGGSSYTLMLAYNSSIWRYLEVTPRNPTHSLPCCQPWAIPTQYSNAGLGWTVSLGRFVSEVDSGNNVAHDLFETPDGARHQILNAAPSLSSTFSNDGSFLRFHSSTTTLHTPDGATRAFWPDGSLRRMTDAFGNYVDVQEETDSGGNVADWHITDSAGRSHYVYFKAFNGDSIPGVIGS